MENNMSNEEIVLHEVIDKKTNKIVYAPEYNVEDLKKYINNNQAKCESYECQINVPFVGTNENGKICLRQYDENNNILIEKNISVEELSKDYISSKGIFYRKAKLIKTDFYIYYNGNIYPEGSYIASYENGVYIFNNYTLERVLEELNISIINKEKEYTRTRNIKEDSKND